MVDKYTEREVHFIGIIRRVMSYSVNEKRIFLRENAGLDDGQTELFYDMSDVVAEWYHSLTDDEKNALTHPEE